MSALEARDLDSFVEAVAEPRFDIDKEYGEDVPKTLIFLAVEEAVGEDAFVSVLMSAGARPDQRNPVLETIPFHEAVRRHDPGLLKLLVSGVRDINIQDGCGSSALHIAAEELIEADQEAADKLLECIGLLLQVPGVDVNAEDMKGETTALQYCAMAGSVAGVDLLLSYGATCGEEARQTIRENIPQFDPARFSKIRTGRPLKNILFNLIELGDNVVGLDSYVTNRDVGAVDWDADNGQVTLLQHACDLGRDGVVSYLLQQGASHRRCATNSRPPAVIAAYHGYHKVLKVFTEKLTESELSGLMILSDEYHGRRTLLHEVVRQNSVKLRTGNTDNVDYQECLKILLDEDKTRGRRQSMAKHSERIINFRDSNGETALHYATQQPDQGIIKLLLRHGANMGVKNNDGKAPVNRILPSTLEEFFNECLESDGIITDDKFKLTFNYNFLAPPLLDAEILEEFEEKKLKDPEDSSLKNPRPETEALWYMSESSQHRPLLKHPLISSFLW